jgi:hypothetical protein
VAIAAVFGGMIGAVTTGSFETRGGRRRQRRENKATQQSVAASPRNRQPEGEPEG